MKVEPQTDVDGRYFACIARTKLIAETLYVSQHSASDTGGMTQEAMLGLSQIADELADELRALRDCYVKVANRLYEFERKG